MSLHSQNFVFVTDLDDLVRIPFKIQSAATSDLFLANPKLLGCEATWLP